jgi:spoIIIJ-associated protein
MKMNENSEKAIQARDFLAGMIRLMGLEVSIVIFENEEEIRLDINGDPDGILIGKRGRVLDDIQLIANRAIYGGEEEGRKRLTVDVEDYRQRRANMISKMACEAADRVMKSGDPEILEFLSPRDRRTVHMALVEDARVRTESSGTGEDRRLTIFPSGREGD